MTHDNDDQWLVWVDFNDESELLKKMMPAATEVKGADDPEYKAKASIDFANGDIRVLISKPSIFGFGSNFQGCHNEIFCGISDSYERFYQAVRRCWRFGQKSPVDVYIILSEKEINMLSNIQKKEKLMEQMQHKMTELTIAIFLKTLNINLLYLFGQLRPIAPKQLAQRRNHKFALHNQRMRHLQSLGCDMRLVIEEYIQIQCS